MDSPFILFSIPVIQFVDLLDKLLGMFAFRAQTSILTLGNATECCHTYTEKFIQIIRVNSKKGKSLK